MTFCRELAVEVLPNGDLVSAWEEYEKYSNTPKYYVALERDGIAYQVFKTARTTWKRKFKELTQ